MRTYIKNEDSFFSQPLPWIFVSFLFIPFEIGSIIRYLNFEFLSYYLEIGNETGNILKAILLLITGIFAIRFFLKIFNEKLKKEWTIEESNKAANLLIKYIIVIILSSIFWFTIKGG
ncbi:MAG: hypothetical protein SVS15_04015, partial [Thermodesulfobacteriota bacterium]|nr:hypothetical protein [Thermodesulfobacteriota bacterium]